MNAIKDKTYTVEEYLAMNAASEEKWEYHNGRIYAMAGGTAAHSIISQNTRRRLSENLDDTDCIVYDSDMQLYIASQNCYVYPDGMVACGKQEYTNDKQLQLTNPILIIEVLSESTREKDRTSKFSWYRTIPSFKEYLLIDADKIWIDSFYKEANDFWRFASASKLSDSIYLHSLQISLSVNDIYNKVGGLITAENQ